MRQGMRGFKSRDDTLGLRESAKGGQRFLVRGIIICNAAGIAEIAVLRANRGVVEPGGHRMSELDLAVRVGEEKRLRALKNAQPAALKTRGMFAWANAFTSGFDADHADGFIFEKRMEKPDGIAAAADAGDEDVRQATFAFQNLAARFDSNYPLKIADHHGVRVRAERGTKDVVSRSHVRDPIAHRFVD